MEESVVADFVGRVHTPDVESDDPVRGRIRLSQRRLVLATADARTTIPLSRVFDVVVGTVPGDLQSFFSDSVTLAYEHRGTRSSVLVEGEHDDLERFTRVLFKALLRDVTVTVRHPAKVGGRVTDATDRTASVSPSPGAIGFLGTDESFSVDLSTVIDYDRTDRTLAGRKRPALVFRHVPDTRTVTSIVTVPDGRTLNVLGRYIRLEYEEVRAEVEALDPTEDELEVLVSIYSAGGEASVSEVVTGDATRTSLIIESLRESELVVDGETGATLTRKGRMVVTSRLESVNS